MPPKSSKRKREEEESDNESKSDPENASENDGSDDENESENGSDDGSENSDNESNEEGSDNDDGSSKSESDEDDDNDEEEDERPAKKKKAEPAKRGPKAAKKAKPAASKKKGSTAKKVKKEEKKIVKKSSSKPVEKDTSGKPRVKVLKKSDRLEEARKAYKWWEAPKLAHGINWKYLEHPGVAFAPPYVPHNIPLKYDGAPVKLTPEQEELATFFAAMPLDGPQLGNAKTAKVFSKNFFEDFKQSLGPSHIIQHFDKIDFTEIREYLTLQKNLKKVATEEEKQLRKDEKEIAMLKYGYALIDGRVEKMGNFNMEPPGLFRGRGEHPKTGKVKRRCFPESVGINLSEDACVPICAMPGHAWESVRHDPYVTWLCGWVENVQDQNKYVMLAASSSFKGKSDMEKYTKAIKLKSHIHKVRQDYTAKIRSKDRAEKQLGTAMWVIDMLALRVGGEKGEDEADTVGCCSLRVEHLTFNPDPESYEIELEFLGKDSMLYKQNINFAQRGDLGKQVYGCLKSFCAGKRPDDDVFETLDPPILNKHLNSLMKGLTAKVFRTFNASITLEKELPSAEDLEGLTVQDKVLRYNAANRQVAILCNHQRTVSKAAETMFENLNERLQTMINQRADLVKWKELAKKNKEKSIPLKEDDKDILEKIKDSVAKAEEAKQKAKTTEEKLAAAQAVEEAKAAEKEDKKRRLLEKHFFKNVPSADSIEGRIEKWTEDIRKLEIDIRNRDENKEVALGTSKINYMDPRISVAWCKRCEVPIDKIFARTLRDKFNWAMAVPPDWKFE